MQILVDRNLDGLARLVFKELERAGWVELLALEFSYFADLNLADDTPDDELWRVAQSQAMVIFTDNRNREDDASLTAVINRENNEAALPVVTIGDSQRLKESGYRQKTAGSLAEIVMYLENYRGTGRIFIPLKFSVPKQPRWRNNYVTCYCARDRTSDLSLFH